MSATATDAVNATQIATEAIKLITALIVLVAAVIPLKLRAKSKRAKKKAAAQTTAKELVYLRRLIVLLGLNIITSLLAAASVFFFGITSDSLPFIYISTAGMISIYAYQEEPPTRSDNLMLVGVVAIFLLSQVVVWLGISKTVEKRPLIQLTH